jgi:hypothetical protein
MRAFFVIMFAMLCVSCSKADVNRTSHDLKAAASHIKQDPAVKKLGSDIKVAAKDTGQELKKGAQDAQTGLKKAGTDIKQSASKAKSDVKSKPEPADKSANG